ncbi:hypothetical protein ACLE20_05500 [Rhizobium sp. YIM 134829]|uniref:hypothetical protein n=1 Tax=Rhizobium sp. YIM 134829 TaxID=3390453 RepID=UPI00397B2619
MTVWDFRIIALLFVFEARWLAPIDAISGVGLSCSRGRFKGQVGKVKELVPAGFSAAGRSLKNPATARKAEKKKRGKGARTGPSGFATAGHRCQNFCARLRHGRFSTR